MPLQSAQSITVVFTTRSPVTGASANADSTPTGTVYVNGTADGASVTVTNVTTGVYKAAVTLPALSFGDIVDLVIAATVDGVADKGVIFSQMRDAVIDASGNVAADLKEIDGSATAADYLQRYWDCVQLLTDQTGTSDRYINTNGNDSGLTALILRLDTKETRMVETCGSGTYQIDVEFATNTVPGEMYLVMPDRGPALGLQLVQKAVALAGSVSGNVDGNVGGKVIGGGATSITGTGVQATVPTGGLADLLAVRAAKIDTIDTNVTTLIGRITSTLFSGITSLANWLRALARSGNIDATTTSEINATTGSGTGTYDPTTDSQQAIADSTADVPTVAEIWAAAPGNLPLNINHPFDGEHIDVFKGDAWESSMGSGRAMTITFESGEAWPDTISTADFYCEPTDQTVDEDADAVSLGPVACTVNVATGSGRQVTIQLTSAQLATLTSGGAGGYKWWVVANRATKPATLRAGSMTVRPNFGA